jgi:hypothetical protein
MIPQHQVNVLAANSEGSADIWIAILGVVISAVIAWVTAKRAVKGDERQALREGNMKLMEWAIDYPFLESESYCDVWPNTSRSDDDQLRYGVYCCHVFNLLAQCWEFCGGDLQKMKHILYPDELIRLHRRWWESDPANQDAYPVGFRQFVSERIRVARESEKSK